MNGLSVIVAAWILAMLRALSRPPGEPPLSSSNTCRSVIPFEDSLRESSSTTRVTPLYRISTHRRFLMCVDRGYPGSPDHFRHSIARLLPKKQYEAFMRLKALPAEEAQVDWGHFCHVVVGRARQPLVAFVMALSWSRMIFQRFFRNSRMESFVGGHVQAFDFFDGTPRTLLYDNLIKCGARAPRRRDPLRTRLLLRRA